MPPDLIVEKRKVPAYVRPMTEFVEPSASDSFIYWLFRYRCIDCKGRNGPVSEINEIDPRSRSKKNILDWRNRVPLCRTCHDEYHRNGVSDAKKERMTKLRRDFLESTGRSEYIVGPTPD